MNKTVRSKIQTKGSRGVARRRAAASTTPALSTDLPLFQAATLLGLGIPGLLFGATGALRPVLAGYGELAGSLGIAVVSPLPGFTLTPFSGLLLFGSALLGARGIYEFARIYGWVPKGRVARVRI